jgi:hypothetical protein
MFYQPLSFTICSSPFSCRQKLQGQQQHKKELWKWTINLQLIYFKIELMKRFTRPSIWMPENNSLKFESTKEIETNSNIRAWFLILGYSTVQYAIWWLSIRTLLIELLGKTWADLMVKSLFRFSLLFRTFNF